jgi:cell division protein FtsL
MKKLLMLALLVGLVVIAMKVASSDHERST